MILAICGAGGLGREVLELASIINLKQQRWDNIIFIDDVKQGQMVNGVKVYTYREAKNNFGQDLELTVGVGEPIKRERIFTEIMEDQIPIATLIHPDVRIPNTAFVGRGVTIQMGNFISCNVSIGDYVYIQPHANIGHDCILKKGCIISAFCNIAGGVSIGEFSYLGSSSVIKEKVSIGNYSIISMASAVYRDIGNEIIAVGNPARPMKRNEDKKVFR